MPKNSIVWSITTAFWIQKLKRSAGGLALGLVLASCGSLSTESNPNPEPTAEPDPYVTVKPNPFNSQDEVVLELQVGDREGYPLPELNEKEIKIWVDGKLLPDNRWDLSELEDTRPRPAYIVVLVDFSGSMNRPAQETPPGTSPNPSPGSGQTKAQAAIATLDDLIQGLSDRTAKTYFSVLPFGEGGDRCPNANNYSLTSEKLGNFQEAGDPLLAASITNLKEQVATPPKGSNPFVCASTNLYDSIRTTIDYLANPGDPRFQPTDPDEDPPRLGLIVLSDGYDNKHTDQRLKDLEDDLTTARQDSNLTVHTLAYGLTAQELTKAYQLPSPATRANVCESLLSTDRNPQFCSNPQQRIPADVFVDQPALSGIAKAGGGLNLFAKNPEEVARNLETFFKAIVGGYEISYTQPNADRGSRHRVVVGVDRSAPNPNPSPAPSPDNSSSSPEASNADLAYSGKVAYRMPTYGEPAKPEVVGLCVGVMVLGGLWGWWMWRNWCEKLNKL
jgi:hypothetical protein